MTRFALLLVLGLGATSTPAAGQDAPGLVWVNLRSGVYHCPGTEFFGRTTRGEFLREPEARRRGHRPNGGRPCHPDPDGPPARRSALDGTTAAPDSSPVRPDSTVTCRLTRIVDGDSIECQGLGPVRLIGMDAPEGDQEPYGTAATAALAALAPPGTELLLAGDVEAADQYRRRLAYAWVGDVMLNWHLVRHGWAVAYRYPPNTRHAAAFERAESRASAERRGLWLVDGFRCRPDDHRGRRC